MEENSGGCWRWSVLDERLLLVPVLGGAVGDEGDPDPDEPEDGLPDKERTKRFIPHTASQTIIN